VGRLKKIWADPVWSKVISVGIVALIPIAYAYSQGWWPYIGQWIVLNSPIPNWLLIILSILVFWKIGEIGIKFIYKPKRKAYAWTSFRKAKIDGIVWHWSYINNGCFDDDSLILCCPRCDYELRRDDMNQFILKCKHCNRNIRELSPSVDGPNSYVEFMDHIKLEIERRIRKVRNI
jgi:hypothetical protein